MAVLAWPQLIGVESFNIYRGDLGTLEDGDADGLPDAGYGSCRNAFDADTTDTQFTDEDLPAEGQGFYYLMERVTALGLSGLGSTSNGLQRDPAVPCP